MKDLKNISEGGRVTADRHLSLRVRRGMVGVIDQKLDATRAKVYFAQAATSLLVHCRDLEPTPEPKGELKLDGRWL